MTPRSAQWLRRVLIALAALPVLALLAVTGVWYVVTGRIESGVGQWKTEARLHGWAVAAGPPERAGWPLDARVTYRDVALTGGPPDLPVPLTWRAPQVRVGVALLHPRLLNVAGEGEERLRFGTGPDVPFTGDVVALAVPLTGRGPSALRAVNLRVGDPGGAGPEGGLTVSSLLAHGGPAAGGFSFDLQAVTIGLPQTYPWLFGPRLAALSAGGALHGPFPPPGAMATTSPAQAATDWRNGGGALELRNVALDWGPLRGSLSGTLGLDGDLQPAGAATFRVEDYPKVLDALAASGRITRQAAMAATAVISLIGHASDQSGGQSVELPLRLQDRTLTLGRIPLTRMPEMIWPSP